MNIGSRLDNSPTNSSRGFDQILVTIQSITNSMAICQDKLGKVYPPVSVLSRVGAGIQPQKGDIWMLSKTNGGWTFLSRVSTTLPIVHSTADLITALINFGFIDPTSSIP